MSAEDPIAAAVGAIVESGELAGAATLVWRGGKVVQSAAVGRRDLETDLPVTRDTIFRIASMSKPVTSAAAMMLFDEGRFALDDPISRWAPEFADMRVLRSPSGLLDDTLPAVRAITFDDLLTHRAGLTYGDFQSGPIAGAYAEALGADIDSHLAPDDWIAGLAALPLIDQPVPLRSLDRPPRGWRMRRWVRCCSAGSGGRLRLRRRRPSDLAPGGAFLPERPDDMTYEGGGSRRLSGLRTHVRRRRRGGWGAAAQAGNPRPDDREPADPGTARRIWVTALGWVSRW